MASKRDTLISSAEKSLQKGKVDAALRDYLKVLEETPNDINILNKAGDLSVRLGRNDDSIQYFLRIAEHYARDGFYVRAIAMYKKVNKLDPARLDIYEKLAELYVKQQLWMEAKSNYQVLADYLLKQDNLGGAIGIYQKMVAIEPQNLQLHVRLADLFTQGKRIPEALREYAVVAAALAERGAHEESIRVYEKALKLVPDNLDILRTLVPLLLSINSVDQARSVLRKGLEASPRSVPLFLLAAEAAVAANDMAEARAFTDKARAVEPENEEVLAAAVRIQLKGRRPDLAWSAAAPLADAAMRRGESKKALALLVPIARAAPDSDDLIRKIVEIAAGTGDEATALPFRSALAELYRRKGRTAEAADLLRHCTRIQPDNAEFRARLAQLEPHAPADSVLPQRVPPQSLERHMEVTVSGLGIQETRPRPPIEEPRAAVPPAPPVAPLVPVGPPAPVAPLALPGSPAVPAKPAATSASADEFEFDLEEVEEVEETSEPLPEGASAAPAPEVPATPPRGLVMPRSDTIATLSPDAPEPDWNTMSAAEALEAFEAREAEARAAEPAPGSRAGEEVEDLLPEAEIGPAPATGPSAPGFPALDLELAAPEGFGAGPARDAGTFSAPQLGAMDLPETSWPSAVEPEASAFEAEAELGPSPYAPTSRPASGDAELDDALIEADVFRRYGLLEKAIDQLTPWLERAPENLKVREKLFEIHLEQGHREDARELAEFLAAAYAATGREERIRGIEDLLGEPLRPAAPAVEEVAETEEPVEAGPEEPAAAEEREAIAPVPAPDFEAEPLPIPAGIAEPATEVLPPLAPAPAEPPGLPFEEPSPATSGVVEPFVAPPAPAAAAPEPSPRAPEPVVPPEPTPSPRPKLSPDELLGFGKKGAPTAPKKPRTVRPEDLEFDLLGTKGGRPKAKAARKPESVLPDDLLSSLHKPVSLPRPARAEPAPAEPLPVARAAEPTASRVEPAPVPQPAWPLPVAAPARPTAEDLSELDFCLDQGMVVDAAERLQSLEGRFPGDAELAARRVRLEGGRGGVEAPRAALHDILSDDLDSVIDAELGRALTEDMVRESPVSPAASPAAAAGAPVLDESGLFSDEQEFFNFADELHTELRKESEPAPPEEGREVSLEEIFRDFKKGVEQQLSPEDYETHYNLGIAYKEMGLTDEAIGEFQLAAKDPLHAVECCAMLGLCFLEKGLPQLAVKWYRKGLETIGIKEGDRLGLQYALASVLEQVGDRDGAYRTYLDIFGSSAGYLDVSERIKALKPFVTT